MSALEVFDDLFVGYEQTPDSAIVRVNSMALWSYFPRQLTQAEAHQLYILWYYQWFVPWLRWLQAQQL